jgi:hypothetical protein
MKPTLHRRDVVNALLADRGELLVVTGLGSTAWDATAAGDHELTFPLWGAMGSAVMIGLGLAIAKPSRRVLVVTGDGEMLMGLGSLATAGVQKPKNLSVVVIDNERYGETGMQHRERRGPRRNRHGRWIRAVQAGDRKKGHRRPAQDGLRGNRAEFRAGQGHRREDPAGPSPARRRPAEGAFPARAERPVRRRAVTRGH